MLLSRPMLFAAVFSTLLHIGMLGVAATWLVAQGRPAPAFLKITLLQRAVPLPVGEGSAPPKKTAELEKQPDLAPPPPPPKPQPKPKPPTPRVVTPPIPKAKKPVPPKKVLAPAPVATPPQPIPAPQALPTPQEGVTAETSAEMPKIGGDSRNAATGTQGAKTTSGGVGFSARPDYGVNPKPPYPLIARRMGTQGVVLLRVHVRVDGTVAEVEIAQSSGSALLDNSALQTVRDSWRFVPARLDGVAVESWVEVPIRFVLEDS